MQYIKVPAVYEKLKKAEELYSPVVVMAGTGWGKSAAVQYYYRRKNPLILSAKSGYLREKPPVKSIRQNVIIIEDAQWITETEDISYIRSLIDADSRQILLLTRGAFPKYLSDEEMAVGFIRITEKDFVFHEEEVRAYFEERGITISPEELSGVTKASRGYPKALFYYANRLEQGESYSEDMQAAVWEDCFHSWDSVLFEQWSEEFANFALTICSFDDFTEEMVQFLLGTRDVGYLLNYSRTTVSFIEAHANHSYTMRPEIRKFFLWKQKICWSEERILENYRKGAYFYEMKGEIGKALCNYRIAGAEQSIIRLLISNARRNPGTGQYVETKDYYLRLPREKIVRSPILMAGMSMLYDLILEPEMSEKWYRELQDFYNNKTNTKESRKEARCRLAYLDIGLPHRGTKGILRIMKDVFILIGKGDVVLPEFAVTGNTPSVMNGGLDFCEWSKNDTQIAKFMRGPVEAIVGKYGKGLVTISLAESGFEKGTMSAYEVLTRCTNGYMAAAHGGKLEMCFAAVGIQVRQHIAEGQYPSAKRLYDNFLEMAEKEGYAHLAPNLHAFSTYMQLYMGLDPKVRSYVESVPDARVEFSILDRYRQMIKIRCLIAEEKLEEAIELAHFLTGYFRDYERHYYWMENELLKSIILFRMDDEHWKMHFSAALLKACEYHFIRLFSLEGQAVLPLLEAFAASEEETEIPGPFLMEIMEEAGKIARFYPDYLKFFAKENVELTKREMQVLSMLCAGMTTENICKELGISYDGLKKHNRNIYRKLGVRDRADAERKALQLGLIYRGK